MASKMMKTPGMHGMSPFGGMSLASVLLVPLASVFAALPFMEKIFAENQFLAAGITLYILSSLSGVMSSLYTRVSRTMYSWFCSSVVIDAKDDVGQWCSEWFNHHGYGDKAGFFNLRTKLPGFASGTGPQLPVNLRKEQKPDFLWAPVEGDRHYFRFQTTLVSFEWKRSQRGADRNNPLAALMSEDKLEVIAWGGSSAVLKRLVDEVVNYKFRTLYTHTRVYTVNESNRWALATTKDRRSMSSVVLDEHVKQEIIVDVERFLDSREWYSECGIPYRRGYLLHGPPGTGKTSFIFSLAGKFDLSISIFSFSGREMSDANLTSLFQALPPATIVVLEDVDTIFLPQTKTKSVTYSGLLNALDGIASGDGRILFMTTNHFDKLSPSLIRPGRIDLKVELGYASADQTRQMVERFFPHTRPARVNNAEDDSEKEPPRDKHTHPFTEKIVAGLGSHSVSPAQLQGWFIKCMRMTEAEVLDDLPLFLEECAQENKGLQDAWDMMVKMNTPAAQPTTVIAPPSPPSQEAHQPSFRGSRAAHRAAMREAGAE